MAVRPSHKPEAPPRSEQLDMLLAARTIDDGAEVTTADNVPMNKSSVPIIICRQAALRIAKECDQRPSAMRAHHDSLHTPLQPLGRWVRNGQVIFPAWDGKYYAAAAPWCMCCLKEQVQRVPTTDLGALPRTKDDMIPKIDPENAAARTKQGLQEMSPTFESDLRSAIGEQQADEFEASNTRDDDVFCSFVADIKHLSCKTHDGCSLVLGQKDKHTKYGFLTLLAAKSQWESECKKVLQVADNVISRRYQEGKTRHLHPTTYLSDNAKEITSKSAQQTISATGASHLTSPPHTQILNRMIEVWWKWLARRSKVLLTDSGFPASFIFFMFQAMLWLDRRMPHSTNPGGMAPKQMIDGYVPDLRRAKRIGSAVVCLDSRNGQGYLAWLIGFSETSYSYYVWRDQALPRIQILEVVHCIVVTDLVYRNRQGVYFPGYNHNGVPRPIVASVYTDEDDQEGHVIWIQRPRQNEQTTNRQHMTDLIASGAMGQTPDTKTKLQHPDTRVQAQFDQGRPAIVNMNAEQPQGQQAQSIKPEAMPAAVQQQEPEPHRPPAAGARPKTKPTATGSGTPPVASPIGTPPTERCSMPAGTPATEYAPPTQRSAVQQDAQHGAEKEAGPAAMHIQQENMSRPSRARKDRDFYVAEPASGLLRSKPGLKQPPIGQAAARVSATTDGTLEQAHRATLAGLAKVARGDEHDPGARMRQAVQFASKHDDHDHEKTSAGVRSLGKYASNDASDEEPMSAMLEDSYTEMARDAVIAHISSVHLKDVSLEEVREAGLPKLTHLIRRLPERVREVYIQAMFVEYNRLVESGALVEFDEGQRPMDEQLYDCVTQLKIGARDTKYPDGRVKARHNLNGKMDKGKIPKYQNHSSMGTHVSLRLFMAIVTQLGLVARKGDIEMAFPHEPMHSPKWMRCPDFVRQQKPGKIVRVIGNLYGDVEAAKTFVDGFRVHLRGPCGFRSCVEGDEAVYVCHEEVPGFGPAMAILWTHMDDFILAETPGSGLLEAKMAAIRAKYKTDDMGPLHGNVVVGANINIDEDGSLTMHLDDWCTKTCLKVFKCQPDKLTAPTTPMDKSVIFTSMHCPNNQEDPDLARQKVHDEYSKYGSFPALLGMTNFAQEMCFPDAAAAHSILARFANDPSTQAYEGILRLLRWIIYHRARGIKFSKAISDFWKLRLFMSSDYARPKDQELDDYRFIGDIKLLSARTGGMIDMGGPLAWWAFRQKQQTSGPVESSGEGELMAFHKLIRKALVVLKTLSYLDNAIMPSVSPPNVHESQPVHCQLDNTAAKQYATAPIARHELKASVIKMGIVRSTIEQMLVVPIQTPTGEMVADPLTKADAGTVYKRLVDQLTGHAPIPAKARARREYKPARCKVCWLACLNVQWCEQSQQNYGECQFCGGYTWA